MEQLQDCTLSLNRQVRASSTTFWKLASSYFLSRKARGSFKQEQDMVIVVTVCRLLEGGMVGDHGSG